MSEVDRDSLTNTVLVTDYHYDIKLKQSETLNDLLALNALVEDNEEAKEIVQRLILRSQKVFS